MFFDRLGNYVTNEEPIVEEPVVESYYDPNRPVRPGFEKPEMFQEGLFDVFKPKPSKETSRPTTIEDVETMHDIVIDKDFKKFITENPNGCKFKYPDNKIVSKEILDFIDDEGDPSICSLNQFIDANCEYDDCIEIYDYCLYIGGWIDDKALYLATNKSSCAPEGSIIFADIIENGYDYTDRIFAKSFKDLLKNANIEKDINEYSEMDLDEMSDYITEATNRTLKELKQHQKDVEKHADITDKAGFHKLVKKNMTTSKGQDNATGVSGVATAKTGTTDILLISKDIKPGSPAEKLFNRLFEIVKKWETDKTTQISTATRVELFSILGFPDNIYDIYSNRCAAKDFSMFKTIKLVLFKSVGTTRVFPKPGYRFFHASSKPDIAKTGLEPSLGSTHGIPDPITRKNTINRSYNKKACFFIAIKNNESLFFNIIDQAFRYGAYLYEYKPRRCDVFYEDLFSRPGHKSVMKDLLNIPGTIPVFLNSNTPLPVKRIDKNIENRLLSQDRQVINDELLKTKSEISRPFEKIKLLEKFKSKIKSANRPFEMLDANCQCFTDLYELDNNDYYNNHNIIASCDEKCEAIINSYDKNVGMEPVKKKLIDAMTELQSQIKAYIKSSAYKTQYKPNKQYINGLQQNIDDIDRKMKSHKNYPAFESYTMFDDENVDDDYITEANEASKKARKNAQEFMRKEYGTSHPTSMTSKQRNRMKKWLKDNDYDPKTGTIATDMEGAGGKPFRVNLETNSSAGKPIGQNSNMPFNSIPNQFYPKEKYTPAEKRAYAGDRPLINMPKEYMKRHPSISTGMSKHEEGHVADYYGKIDDIIGKRIKADEHIKQSMKKGMDYSPTHTDIKENIADLYSAQHNKYKDKLRFLNTILSEDIHMQRKFKENWKDICKSVYKKQSNDRPPIIDASSVETMRDSLKNLVSRTKATIKSYKAQLKTPMYPSGKNLLNRLIDSGKDACNEYEKILRKWFIGKLLFKKVDYDDAKVMVDKAVWHDAKLAVDEAIRQNDGDIEIRKEFLKQYINEFAVEYNMSTVDVIQEMYQTAFEDYVFQEDFEDEEPFDYDVFIEAKIDAAERNELDDDDFGLVYYENQGTPKEKKIRKYPLTDKIHVQKAVQFFGSCPPNMKGYLASRILKKAKTFGMDTSNWTDVNKAAEKNELFGSLIKSAFKQSKRVKLDDIDEE